ncbi:WD domain, G-beta repeat-containing protein, putative [Eimeria praecox]|uniref:WD domain, G-beta repeat-containing protein, putative n=1 Tax=Eimeria praecox TaxID=51316 RepID=U6H4A4_9EIME|nr:WD domain, G-beta repeat-containing protein, putative [Eimeria praecox]
MAGGQLKMGLEFEQYCRPAGTSRCLLGHNGVIEFLEVALEARLAATVENASEQPSIRIWKLPPVGSDSEDVRCTALVGSDRLNRQQLQVWELHALLTTGRPNLLARQVSDFQIEALRISPLEELRLVSCGKENIRFWRIKNGHLPGCNVTLDGLGRGNLFTDLAFVLPDQAMISSPRPGFCVTASADKTVKVWPLNFMAAYFSAIHNSECVGVETAPDGQQVLCTCGDSSVELLDLTTQQHLQVSRAHPARVLHASASGTFDFKRAALRELYTVCEDGLVRVWTLPQLSQTFEMESPQDPPLCVAAHPTQRVLALGFRSGAVRVLAVEGPAVWMEANHHTHPITGIWFVQSPEVATDLVESCARQVTPHAAQQQSSTDPRELLKAGNDVLGQSFLVISLDATGCICIFSQIHEFALIRKLENPQVEKAPEGVPALAFASDGSKAARYFSSRALGLLRLPKFNFEAEFCPFPTACKSVVITTYSFSASGDSLCVCGSDSRMRIFSFNSEVGTPSFHQSREIALLSGSISVAWISSAGLEGSSVFPVGVTCGEDSLIKVWNLAKLSTTQGNEGSSRPEGSAWRETDGPGAASQADTNYRDCSGSPTHNSSTTAFAAAGITAEFPQFQSFAGHNRPPFMVQLLGDYLVSVSATETITWRVGSPLLSAASDITPAGSIALLPPLQEGSASADPPSVDSPCLQQQPESEQQTNCEQAKLPQPQQPPRAHPQPLNQPLPNSLQGRHNTVGQNATSCSSNDATLGKPPTVNSPAKLSPSDALPNSASAAAAATSIPPAEPAPSSAAADETHGFAAAPSASPLAVAAAQRINGVGLNVPDAPLLEDDCHASSAAVVVDTINTSAVRSQHRTPGVGGERSRETSHVPNVKVFPGVVETSMQLEASIHIGQQLAVSQRPHESVGHWGARAESAAARHVIGTAVASCRSSCLWRPLKGVLAHAVGNWVLIERLSTPATSQDGRCLGLLPALLGRSARLRMQQQQISPDSPKRKSSALQRQQRGLQLLQQCAAMAQAPRISVLRHSIVGPAIAFAIDTTARLAATISVLSVPDPPTAHAGSTSTGGCRHICTSCGSMAAEAAAECGGQTISCLGLCLWKAEGGGELLGAARLPRAYGEAGSFRLNRQRTSLGCPDRDAEELPGVLFCGSDLIVTAGGTDGSRLDVWRVSDFLPPSKYFGNSQRNENPPVEAGKTGSATATGNCCPCQCSGSCGSCSCPNKVGVSVFGRLMQCSNPAVGAEVGTPLRKLLSAASNDEREVVFVSLRSVTLWRIVPADCVLTDTCNSSITCGKAKYLAYSTGAFTRRATVDLIRVLEMQQGLGPQSVDLRQQATLQPLVLDAPIKSLQLDGEAQEGIAATAANTIWYLHWDQRAQVRLHSGHSHCITQLAVSHQAAMSSGGPKSSRLQHLSRGTEVKGDGDLPLIATADSGGSLRLWSRWPLPQQLADFSLPHPCTALAFLWRSLLLGCFKDGSLRLFDTNAFRLVGRLQLATTQDPPVAIACLGDRHALLATASGELLSLVLDLRFKDKSDSASLSTPQIKHASVSKIASALTACFGPTFTLQQPPATARGNSCTTRRDCSCGAPDGAAAAKVVSAVECLVGQRQSAGSLGVESRVRFALCLSGGYCSVGAYTRTSPENKWMICSKSWQVFPQPLFLPYTFPCLHAYQDTHHFGVRIGPEEGAAEPSCWPQLVVSRASFSGSKTLLIGRGVHVYFVDYAEGVFSPRGLGRTPVAAICPLREDTAVIATGGGEALLLQVAAGSVASVGQAGIHPNLPRAFEGPASDPICLAAYGEDEVVVACGSSLSIVHVL